MNRTLSGFAMLLLLTASPVWGKGEAHNEDPFSSDRFFYLAGGIPVGEYLDVDDDLEAIFLEERNLDVSVKVGEIIGVDLRAGYRIHRNIAAEVQFQWFSGANIKFNGVKALKLETWTITGNLKGYVLTERLEALANGMVHPYLVAGVGVMGFEVRDTVGLGLSNDGDDLVARFGGGVDIYLAPNVGFYLEVIYMLTTGDVEGRSHVSASLGALVRF